MRDRLMRRKEVVRPFVLPDHEAPGRTGLASGNFSALRETVSPAVFQCPSFAATSASWSAAAPQPSWKPILSWASRISGVPCSARAV